MEQHPVPRQITTFEFKLIGFMTVKQFIYLIIFIPLGLIFFYLFPVPFLNFVLAALIVFLGIALAFLPIQDRPLDSWIVNLYKRLTSPTQYYYYKNNSPIYFLSDVFINSSYIEDFIKSQQYLNQYLQKRTSQIKKTNKEEISQLFNLSYPSKPQTKKESNPEKPLSSQTAFLTGVVKNYKLIPLPGILIYIKNNRGELTRLLKTNPHGVFATFKPLVQGEYIFEIKDPKNIYDFDTIKIKVENTNPKPIEIYSKELL